MLSNKEQNQPEIEDMFYEVANDVVEILCRKNHDYGDSFFEQYRRFGDISTAIRLHDKLNRIEKLTNLDAKVNDESIEDTLLDIAGYAILTLVSKKRLKFLKCN